MGNTKIIVVSDYGDAGSRPRTDTVNTKVQSANTSEFNFRDNWTSLVQEIVNRWVVYGNDMGFVFTILGQTIQKLLGFQNLMVSIKLNWHKSYWNSDIN